MDELIRDSDVRNLSHADIRRMSDEKRQAVAKKKYAAAIEMYASTDLTLKQIADLCGVKPGALSLHIGRHHRNLLFNRYGLAADSPAGLDVKVKSISGQSLVTQNKYKTAIEACSDPAYMKYTVSEVAHLFKLDPTAFASQLRAHYPDILSVREAMRRELGFADNLHRGPRPSSIATYSKAVEMYRDTDLTIPKVAEICGVSKGGFIQYLRFYHKEVMELKAAARSERSKQNAQKKKGENKEAAPIDPATLELPTGDTPQKQRTFEKYRAALYEYATTTTPLKEVAARHGFPYESLFSFVTRNCPEARAAHLKLTAANSKKK